MRKKLGGVGRRGRKLTCIYQKNHSGGDLQNLSGPINPLPKIRREKLMPYKNKEDRKKQTNKPVGSKEFTARMERQRARQKMDAEAKKNGGDKNKNGKADKREGKDVSHKKALSKGGKNKDGVTIESKAKNRSRNYAKKK